MFALARGQVSAGAGRKRFCCRSPGARHGRLHGGKSAASQKIWRTRISGWAPRCAIGFGGHPASSRIVGADSSWSGYSMTALGSDRACPGAMPKQPSYFGVSRGTAGSRFATRVYSPGFGLPCFRPRRLGQLCRYPRLPGAGGGAL